MESTINKPGNPYYSNSDTTKPKCLMPNGKKVLTKICGSRNADTERAFTGKLWDSEAKGTYYYWHGNKLFKSVKVR
jgi:peptide methionine sulfoxide reductase MsrB